MEICGLIRTNDYWKTKNELNADRIKYVNMTSEMQKQLIQKELADMALVISKAKLTAQSLARLKEQGILSFEQISAAKLDNVRSACEVVAKARRILGAAGLTYDMPVGAHMLNLETVRTYEGTEEIHTLILGKHLTGFSAF